MIRAEKLTKRYRLRGKDIHALRDVSFEVEDGDFVIIVGPSGSGKSTLLLTLGGLIHPTCGKVFTGNKSIYELSAKERAEIRRRELGFLFQTFNLIPYLTALENVQISLYLAGKTSKEQREIAAQLLEKVGLGDRLEHKPSELSVGQQQRVALARALANNPRVLLADEPTGSLDPSLSQEMLDWLRTLHEEGHTIVMVTHDHEAARHATRSLNLIEGSLSESQAMKIKVLFVCVENACRSQMAEGFANHVGRDKVVAYSAGSKPVGAIDPVAVHVMKEKGIDISRMTSKGFAGLPASSFDYTVTMGCKDLCPFYPGRKRIDWDIPSPRGKNVDEFRRIRDEIEKRVVELIDSVQ